MLSRIALVCAVLTMSSCTPRLTPPRPLATGSALWAIVPFTNESGVSIVDTAALADIFMMQAQQVEGLNVLPVNRVIAAMRRNQTTGINSPGEAFLLMKDLKVDGLIVGTVTAYDPYRPMKLGVAVQLYATEPFEARVEVDTRKLVWATSGHVATSSLGPAPPVGQAAGVFDASNHRTLAWLQDYAKGRDDPESPFNGIDRYMVSMDWYAQFVCYRLLHDLLVPSAAQARAAGTEQVSR